MKQALYVLMGALCLSLPSCGPALVEEPKTEIIRGTSRPNAIDQDSFYADRREGRFLEWRGGAKTASFREALRLRYNVDGEAIRGEYALGSVGILNFGYLGFGKIEGTVTGGIIDWVLTMEDGCQYTVFGSATDDHLRAYAEPINCRQNQTQEWDLRRS